MCQNKHSSGRVEEPPYHVPVTLLTKFNTKSPRRLFYPHLTGQMTDTDKEHAFVITNVRAMMTVSVMTENRGTGYAPRKQRNLLILHMLNVQCDFGHEKDNLVCNSGVTSTPFTEQNEYPWKTAHGEHVTFTEFVHKSTVNRNFELILSNSWVKAQFISRRLLSTILTLCIR